MITLYKPSISSLVPESTPVSFCSRHTGIVTDVNNGVTSDVKVTVAAMSVVITVIGFTVWITVLVVELGGTLRQEQAKDTSLGIKP